MYRKSLGLALVILPLFLPACSKDTVTNPVRGPEFYGTFTILDAGAGAFEHLVGVPIEFNISFSQVTDMIARPRGSEFPYLEFTTDAASFSFAGDQSEYLEKTVGPNLDGVPLTVKLARHFDSDEVLINDAFAGTQPDENFAFGIFVYYDATFDSDGIPILEDFRANGSMFLMRMVGDPIHTTDTATGTMTISLRGTSDL